MINIAAVIDNLGPSQKSFYLIKEFNKAERVVKLNEKTSKERGSKSA